MIKHNCPYCKKPVTHIQSEFPIGDLICYVYQCGHVETRKKFQILEEPTKEDINSINAIALSNYEVERWNSEAPQYLESSHKAIIPESFWSIEEVKEYFCKECNEKHTRLHAYPYQRIGVAFAEKAQLSALIADAMGLGKTIQALIAIKRAQQSYNNDFPTLALVKGNTLYQWAKEFSTWVSKDFGSVIPVMTRNQLVPGFQFYVMSMDLLSRKGVLELLATLNLRCVIIDECQFFKNDESDRSKALKRLVEENNIQYKLPLSGTPIKNRADEFFTILNLLDPNRFTSKKWFRRQWLIENEKGQYTKINPLMQERFKEITSKYIIRREKHEELKDLPDLRRDYQLIEIEDPLVKKSYNHELDLFSNFLRNEARITSQQILGWLAKLRAITGQAKCKNAIDFVEEFLENTDEKIAIGVHHHSVTDTVEYIFRNAGYAPLRLDGMLDSVRKDKVVQAFNLEKSRILIISALAGGVGLNLQTCANALVLERQWNSADEEQFESRFHRNGQKKAVTITYLIARNTIDEFFHDLVHEKRKILVSAGFGAPENEEMSVTDLKDFAELIIQNRL